MAEEDVTLEERVEDLADDLREDVEKIMEDFKERLLTLLEDAGVFYEEDEEDDGEEP